MTVCFLSRGLQRTIHYDKHVLRRLCFTKGTWTRLLDTYHHYYHYNMCFRKGSDYTMTVISVGELQNNIITTASSRELITPIWTVPLPITKPVFGDAGVRLWATKQPWATGSHTWICTIGIVVKILFYRTEETLA